MHLLLRVFHSTRPPRTSGRQSKDRRLPRERSGGREALYAGALALEGLEQGAARPYWVHSRTNLGKKCNLSILPTPYKGGSQVHAETHRVSRFDSKRTIRSESIEYCSGDSSPALRVAESRQPTSRAEMLKLPFLPGPLNGTALLPACMPRRLAGSKPTTAAKSHYEATNRAT